MATCSRGELVLAHKLATCGEHKVGVGLVDFLMTENTHPETEQQFPAYNVQNIKEYPDYAIDQKIGAPNKIWIIKTNQSNAGSVDCPNIPFPTYHGGRQEAC